MKCDHPYEKRWQYRGYWMCCACCRYFWGKKADTPATDYVGRPA